MDAQSAASHKAFLAGLLYHTVFSGTNLLYISRLQLNLRVYSPLPAAVGNVDQLLCHTLPSLARSGGRATTG
jgi:hypothetical protein